MHDLMSIPNELLMTSFCKRTWVDAEDDRHSACSHNVKLIADAKAILFVEIAAG